MSYILHRPTSLQEAISLQLKTGGAYLAGGTVTLVNYHKRRAVSEDQISLDAIKELRGIELKESAAPGAAHSGTASNKTLSIGALTTMDELESSENVKKYAYALWQAASEVGGPQIRNRATLGGNLASASPSSDCATPLLAMNTSLVVCGAAGSRVISLRDFFLGRFQHVLTKDEIIVSVEIPVFIDETTGESLTCSSFRKVGKRNALAVSCLNMAVVRTEDQVDVAVGAAAPKVVYCVKTSQLLSASPADISGALEAIQTEISPIDDRWATASYRRTVCGNMLKALLNEVQSAELEDMEV